jgi:hypothetical protein
MPEMQSVVQNDFDAYTNSVGLLTEWKNPGAQEADNGFCHTACQVLCYTLSGVDQSALRVRFRTALWNSMVQYDAPGWARTGLFNRSPGIEKQIAWDDLIGIAYVDRAYASALMQRGQCGVKLGPFRIKYVYNNVNPEKFTWDAYIGRSWSFVAHLYWATGRVPPWWARLAWVATLLWSGSPTNQDPWKLSRFLVETYKRTATLHWAQDKTVHKLEKWAVDRWEGRFIKAWPGGFGALFARYFVAGADHPLAKHWPKEF